MSGLEVKLKKTDTPATQSQDEDELDQDDNENTLEEIENNLGNQGLPIIFVDEEGILKPEVNNLCSTEVKAECPSFACDQCGYFSIREAHLELHK